MYTMLTGRFFLSTRSVGGGGGEERLKFIVLKQSGCFSGLQDGDGVQIKVFMSILSEAASAAHLTTLQLQSYNERPFRSIWLNVLLHANTPAVCTHKRPWPPFVLRLNLLPSGSQTWRVKRV